MKEEIETALKAARQKLEQERAKLERLEARKKATESKANRARDTRRKILLGSVILSKVSRGEWTQTQLLQLADEGLTRPDDRALFGLPPLPDPPGPKSSTTR
jgi:hypothetical protein